MVETEDRILYVTPEPYNYRMPSYHRLDIGFSYRYKTRHGHKAEWRAGVWNVYARKNPVAVMMNRDKEGTVSLKGYVLFPIMPSVNYMLSL